MRKNTSSGFIQIILIIVVIIVLLAYFNINLRAIISSEAWRDNWVVIKEAIGDIWDKIGPWWTNYVTKPAMWVWENWVLGWVWPLVSSWFQSQS